MVSPEAEMDRICQEEHKRLLKKLKEVKDQMTKLVEAEKAAQRRLDKLKEQEDEQLKKLEQIEKESKETKKERKKKAKHRKVRAKISLDNLIIGKQLGIGASGSRVFSCILDGWICAMKQLDISVADQIGLDNFEKEIRILQKLPRHPNIVRFLCYDLDYAQGRLRLFMTRYSCTLRDVIREREESNTTLPLHALCTQAYDIACGLAFIHERNVIHRDLKTENIYGTKDERGELRGLAIGDFDISLILTHKTKAKSTVGTYQFMAPEVFQSQGDSSYTTKADVFSFGMVMYSMMTNSTPFSKHGALDIMEYFQKGKRPSMNEELLTRYSPLIPLFVECTDPYPNNRPSSSDCKALILRILRSQQASSASGTLSPPPAIHPTSTSPPNEAPSPATSRKKPDD